MKCPRDLLGLYLDNELSPAQTIQVERHLQQCASCTAELENLQSIAGILGSFALPELDEDFLQGVMAMVEAEPSPLEIELARRKRLAKVLGWGSSILGVGLLAAVVSLFYAKLNVLFWSLIAWLWGQVNMLGAPANTLFHGWEGIKNLTDVLVQIFEGNQFLLLTVTLFGLLLILMAREILDDLQRVLGYHE